VAITRDGQYEVDGLLMGKGTGYVVDQVIGLGGAPATKTVDRNKEHDDGSWAGVDRFEPREVVMAVGLDGDLDEAAYEALITDLGAVMIPRAQAIVFRYQRFGRIRRLYGRPRGFVLPWDDDFFLGAGRAALRFEFPDPVIYSDEEVSEGPTSGAFDVENEGNYPVWPVITTDAGGDFVFTNTTTGEAVVLEDLPSAAAIDFQNRTVFTVVGDDDEYGTVQPSPDWWQVQPGVNALDFTGSATITFRHGWATG
jgi:hypothetical protein